MRFSRYFDQIAGAVLLLMCCGALLWLGGSGQLKLYIHPRYELFAISMAAVGFVGALASIIFSAKNTEKLALRQRVGLAAFILISGCLFILPPRSLSTTTATQRIINSSAPVGANEKELLALRGSYANFTVKDWAGLLKQSSDQTAFHHKAANLTGFVSQNGQDENVFFVSRFVISCCAVDARPVGVAVYKPGWKQTIRVDDWVEVSGEFASWPNDTKKAVILPDYVRHIEKPKEPYVY